MSFRDARQAGWMRALAALILAVFFLGPTLCIYDCAADDLAPTKAVASASVAASQGGLAEHGVGKAQVCPHGGHCHQNPFANIVGGEAQAGIIAYTGVCRVIALSLAPESESPLGLERPPRA